jgi:hypothetical protein
MVSVFKQKKRKRKMPILCRKIAKNRMLTLPGHAGFSKMINLLGNASLLYI